MSQLIGTAGLLSLTDLTGAIYRDLIGGTDSGGAHAQAIAADLLSVFSADIDQALAWYPAARAMYGAGAGASSATGLFGAASTGSLSGGQGLLSRGGMVPAVFFGWLEKVRQQIQTYGSAVDASIVDVPTFAAYANRTPLTCLFTPDFASAYYLAYGGARQLAPASVFAPAHTAIAALTVTGADAVTCTDTYPRVNGYTTPASTTDAYGNALYAGGLPMAQGFAPPAAMEVLITTVIAGTCALTLTGPDQAGSSITWTATLDSLAVGQTAALTPSHTGSRLSGAITAAHVTGSATSGAAAVRVTADERSVS